MILIFSLVGGFDLAMLVLMARRVQRFLATENFLFRATEYYFLY